ncbi:MAG: glutathione S-transferase family protein [Pseudomonadota bacterium]|nr:glutathione S-transferase family protein [Pseudomonadota bacterium]
MLTLYDNADSGNGYKVRLLLHMLEIRFRRVEVAIFEGESRKPGFLRRNPNGRIPTVEFDDGSHLWESNALLWYFAEGTRFIPEERRARAEVLQWMFFEQYSHEPYIAVLRAWTRHGPVTELQQAQVPWREREGYRALGVMEAHLDGRDWFVDGRMSIADIALYAYTHVAGQGGFDLTEYPAVRAWLDRVAAQPGFVPLDAI